MTNNLLVVPARITRSGYSVTSAAKGFDLQNRTWTVDTESWTVPYMLELIKFGIEFRIRAALQSSAEGQADAEKKFAEIVARISDMTIGRGPHTAASKQRRNPLAVIVAEMNKDLIRKSALKLAGLQTMPKTADKEGVKAFDAAQATILSKMLESEKFTGPAKEELARRQALLGDIGGSEDEADDLFAELGIEI